MNDRFTSKIVLIPGKKEPIKMSQLQDSNKWFLQKDAEYDVLILAIQKIGKKL